ncbi:MAG: ADP-ribose pyrophosphatase [Oleiphilaceae bacterium]|jgi:ADP-ribose pyrophosphatase
MSLNSTPTENRILISTEGQQVEIETSEIAYNGFFKMMKYRLRHSLFNGGMSNFFTREVMTRPDAVAVLLFDPSSECVILTKQFRIGALESSNAWLEELVAGIIEPGEEPEDVARRETLEETGLTLTSKLEKIAEYYGSPGGLSEKTIVYFAEIDSSSAEGVHGLDSENEDILVVKKPIKQLFDEVDSANISNASLMITGLWLKHRLANIATDTGKVKNL